MFQSELYVNCESEIADIAEHQQVQIYLYTMYIACAFHYEIWYTGIGFDIQYFIPSCCLHTF